MKMGQDMLVKILLTLPPKTLMRFKRVSKWWSAFIYNPGFVSKHLSNSANNNLTTLHVFLARFVAQRQHEKEEDPKCNSTTKKEETEEVLSFLEFCKDDDNTDDERSNGCSLVGVQDIIIPQSLIQNIGVPEQQFGIEDHCNGIVLLSGESSLVLCNPGIGEFNRIPDEPCLPMWPLDQLDDYDGQEHMETGFHTRFGYDPMSNEYKFVTFTTYFQEMMSGEDALNKFRFAPMDDIVAKVDRVVTKYYYHQCVSLLMNRELACLNTWCYLLHKLDTSLSDSSIIRMVLEPVVGAVFQVDPDNIDYDSLNQVNHQLLGKTSRIAPFVSGSFSWKQYPIKWFPWRLSLLDFHLKMIYILICQASREIVSHDNRISAADASLRLFRSVLKGVQLELKWSSISYDIMFRLNAILKFVKNTCEKVSSDCSDRNDLHHMSLQLVEAVCEEIEHTIVGSPLYRVPFDIKCIDNLQILVDIGCAKSGVTNAYMDMVSPMVYLSVLYFCLVVQSTMTEPKTDINLQRMQNYFKYLLSMFDPLESLVVTTGLLYKHSGPSCLRMWIAVAEGLKFYIDDMKGFWSLKNGV
ncbi:hypothetical protein C1H46_025278 [Malus baccata]|uniref:F-box domain-containing protein n=1 Tax=Malus baccata TaxID=106549 RepID=A0A540LRZ8_MALBA|nr:hypothetical protein C1H46_025278 [Malus baccata]